LFKKFRGIHEKLINMPPRAKKAAAASTAPPPADPPIVYFLRVSKEAQNLTASANGDAPVAATQPTEYADILKQEIVSQQFDETVIHEIVAKIHQQTEYPAGTACFWCCHPFAWAHIVLPTYYDAYTNHYSAEGHFCSPECALAWNYDDARITGSQRWLRHSLLQALYSLPELHKAPDKRVLRLFGGTLSIDQYRRYVKEKATPLQLAMPPIRLYMPSINTQATTRDIKSYVSLSNEAVDKASQQLRLKRSKPVHSNVATLDKCMGFGAT
jgi:hypothetical protein